MENKELTNINDAAYQKLIDNITTLWGECGYSILIKYNERKTIKEQHITMGDTGKIHVAFIRGGGLRPPQKAAILFLL